MRQEEAVERHVAFVRVYDEEIALWRDDTGHLNAWENRCPHRGLRLTLGTNTGNELKCRYHGWRFASGTGVCSSIPAHPNQTPPVAAVVRRYNCVETMRYVWVSSSINNTRPDIPEFSDDAYITLRSITIAATLANTINALEREEGVILNRDSIVQFRTLADETFRIVFLLQPESEHQTTVHCVADLTTSALENQLDFLRRENDRLKAFRRRVEANRTVGAST